MVSGQKNVLPCELSISIEFKNKKIIASISSLSTCLPVQTMINPSLPRVQKMKNQILSESWLSMQQFNLLQK